jgi:hypothetical protein
MLRTAALHEAHMKNVDLSDPAAVRRAGLEALAEALGPVGMVLFLHQFEKVSGDYTRDRHEWLDPVDLETLLHRLRERPAQELPSPRETRPSTADEHSRLSDPVALRNAGIEALSLALGPIGMALFLHQLQGGDPIVQRREWAERWDLDTILQQVEKLQELRRNAAPAAAVATASQKASDPSGREERERTPPEKD